MVNIEKIFTTDLYKKHKGIKYYNGFYLIRKRIYQDDVEIITDSIALDKETLEALRVKIMAILINELPPTKKSKSTSTKSNKN